MIAVSVFPCVHACMRAVSLVCLSGRAGLNDSRRIIPYMDSLVTYVVMLIIELNVMFV